MSEKSIVQEARDIQLAMELITLGARLQMLESETQLSRGRLIKLYKELGDQKLDCSLFIISKKTT